MSQNTDIGAIAEYANDLNRLGVAAASLNLNGLDSAEGATLINAAIDSGTAHLIQGYGAQYVAATLKDADAIKLLNPYSFVLNETDYLTYAEQLKAIFDLNKYDKGDYGGVTKPGQSDVDNLITADTNDNAVFLQPSVSDTSVGGNEAINSRYGFCRDDDIIQPINAFLGKPELGGLGRVYRETYDATQQLLYITAGVPEFASLYSFYSNAINTQIASDVNNADWTDGIARDIGAALGWCATLPVKAVMWPFKYLRDFLDWATNKEHITKYYDFVSAMPLYYKYVNSILVHLGTNLGLYSTDALLVKHPSAGTGGTVGNNSKAKFADVLMQEKNGSMRQSTLPDMFKYGPSIYRILSKRNYKLNLQEYINTGDSDEYLEKEKRLKESDTWTTFKMRAKAASVDADKYICFRIDKNTESTESFSNSTGQSAVQQTLNAAAMAGKNANFAFMGGKIADVPILGGILSGVKSMVEGAVSQLGVANIASAVLTGAGFFDIPEVWMSSSFTKNYSFNMSLRVPYGDPLSVLQGLYVPLAMLLPLACPRSVGMNSYTSPFVIRMYSKGQFAVPLGIIDSMTITRGAAEYGWTMNKLPTVLNISFTVKDLSPLMHMSLAAGGIWAEMWGANSSFNEYLMTLSGLGLAERLLFSNNIARRQEVIANMVKTTWGSPSTYLGTTLGGMSLFKLAGMFSPYSGLGNK